MGTNQKDQKKQKIGIIGGGSFGTALANLLSEKSPVQLWAREPEIVDSINQNHLNPFLKNIVLNPFQATTNLKEVCKNDILIFVIPTQFIRSVLQQTKDEIPEKSILINAAKGIEQKTLLTISGIFSEIFGESIQSRFAALSGPTFAEELAKKMPSAAVIASTSHETALTAQKQLSLPTFRLYTGEDVLGVELGGALKNVMAIGTGIAEGLGFGFNTRAGLMTRCLYEIAKLGEAMGAHPLTFLGLAGLGDLVLTCTGSLSRNRNVGLQLGQGKKLEDILKESKSVAEGVATAKSAYELAKKYKVEMPNAAYVYRILFENLSPKKALEEMMARELTEEMKGL